MAKNSEEMAGMICEIVKKLNGTTLHCQLRTAAQREVEKPDVQMSSLKEDVIRSFKKSGWEKLLRNQVYAFLSRSQFPLNKSISMECQKEPLLYIRKAQANWERRILKSMNSMCTELSIPLSRKRPPEEQRALLHKWNEMGTDEPDLSHFRPVYAPKDFLEVIISLRNPNYSSTWEDDDDGAYKNHWGLIQVPLEVPTLKNLQERFSEFSHVHAHAGVDDSVDVPSEVFQSERNKYARKVLDEKQSAIAQNFCRTGCPSGCRADMWELALGVTVSHLDALKYDQLKGYVLQHDLLVDSLIYKDVKLTSVNDDYYFVFEDYLYQVLLIFSRDTSVLDHFARSSANPPKAFIKEVPNLNEADQCDAEEGQDSNPTLTDDPSVDDNDKAEKVSAKPVYSRVFGNRQVPIPTESSERSTLKPEQGKLGQEEYSVIYPPNGVIPFHGFSMYVTPLCYLYSAPTRLYSMFREFYTRFFHRLHSISSHSEGIVSLCLLFETTLQSLHPRLCRHLQEIGCQPLRIAFKWLVRAFAGYLATDQLLLLWDRIVGYGSLLFLPILAVAIFLFRQSNLLLISTASGVEASMADITTLQIVPLIQLVLFPT